MNTMSLDDQLSAAWATSTAQADLGGAPDRAGIVRRVRSRRRRTYAVRGTVTAVACLALTGGGIAVASTIRAKGFAPETSPSTGLSPTPTASASDDPLAVEDPAPGKPVNILVTRVVPLEFEDVGFMPGLDSALLVHFSADRSRIEVVPLSNFAEVDSSGCGLDSELTSGPPLSLVQAFNAAVAGADVAAGLDCVSTALTATTGVEIDGHTTTDFAGFVDVVDALGGIEICVPEALAAPRAHLDLAAGWQTLDGAAALSVARTREGATYDAHSTREGRVYAAILTGALESPEFAVATGDGAELMNGMVDTVRSQESWTVQPVAAPQVVAVEALAAPWDSNAQAVFDALAADRPGTSAPVGCE